MTCIQSPPYWLIQIVDLLLENSIFKPCQFLSSALKVPTFRFMVFHRTGHIHSHIYKYTQTSMYIYLLTDTHFTCTPAYIIQTHTQSTHAIYVLDIHALIHIYTGRVTQHTCGTQHICAPMDIHIGICTRHLHELSAHEHIRSHIFTHKSMPVPLTLVLVYRLPSRKTSIPSTLISSFTYSRL